jgi:hypothetical protein
MAGWFARRRRACVTCGHRPVMHPTQSNGTRPCVSDENDGCEEYVRP